MLPVASDDGPLVAEVYMGFEPSATTVRATVVQAATVFYDTSATIGEFWLFVVIDIYIVVAQFF